MTRILVLALLLVAAACGDSDGGSGVDAGDPTTTVSSLPSAGGSDDASGDGDQTRPADGTDAYAVADLTVEVTHPDEETITYRLSCLADTATVDDETGAVSAEAACRQLTDAEAVTRLVDGADPDRACTQIFGGPDEARVTGTLDGDEVDTVIDRSNGCAISDWDDVLGDVLPPPATDR